jgi:hypothetical protein
MSDAGVPHALRARSLDAPPRLAVRVDDHRPREPRAPPSTPGPPAVRGSTTPVTLGPNLLGLAVPPLGGLADHSRHRPARHRSGVAPPRLPALLALEVPSQAGWPAEARLQLRPLIRRMARENPTWGRRRIRAELALLGYEVAELTVAKYMRRTSPRPSPTWHFRRSTRSGREQDTFHAGFRFITCGHRSCLGFSRFVIPSHAIWAASWAARAGHLDSHLTLTLFGQILARIERLAGHPT